MLPELLPGAIRGVGAKYVFRFFYFWAKPSKQIPSRSMQRDAPAVLREACSIQLVFLIAQCCQDRGIRSDPDVKNAMRNTTPKLS